MKKIKDPNIWRVYGATVVLGLAYGLAISVIALYLDDIGYSKQEIGSLAAWFAGGIVAFSIPAGGFIRKVGARRVLVGSLLTYAFAVMFLPIAALNYWTLAGVRVIDGMASVGIWVSCETMLLQRSSATNKGFVMSLYSIAIATGYIVGPIAAKVITMMAPLQIAFFVAGGLAIASALIAMRLDREVDEVEELDDAGQPTRKTDAPDLTTGELLWKIKNSCLATFSYGYFQASVVLFLPLYLVQSTDIPIDKIVLIPAWFAAGMFIFSSIAGRVADTVGHLRVMRMLAILGLPVFTTIPIIDNYWILGACVFWGGATMASISPVSLAFQGHAVPHKEHARANAIYNAFYATGMLIGPPITSQIFVHYGGAAMLYHFSGIWAFFAVFTVVFYKDDPRVQRHLARRRVAAS